MPATIIVAHGLLSPLPVFSAAFTVVGERVNGTVHRRRGNGKDGG